MPTNMRRMTIIIPDEVEEQLDILKKEFYYAVSRSEMVRDLIGIGIQEKLCELDTGQNDLTQTAAIPRDISPIGMEIQ